MNNLNPLVLLVLVAASTGCGNYSNTTFEEDVLFAEAIPSLPQLNLEDRMDLDPTLPTSRLLNLSLDTADGLDILIAEANLLAARAVLRTPTSRTADTRVWGPYELEDGSEASLEVTRYDTEVWGWTGTRTAPGSTEARAFYSGWIDRQPEAEAEGRAAGGFEMDLEVLSTLSEALEEGSGTVTAGYQLPGAEPGTYNRLDFVLVGVYQPTLIDQRYAGDYLYQELANAERSLEAAVQQGPDSDSPQTFEIVARWAPDGGGRADALTGAPDQPPSDARVDCWDARGIETYSRSDLEEAERGSAELCPYSDVKLP